MYNKTLLITAIAGLLGMQQASAQWSLSGNSNATNASKLGTTNAIPLRLFTNNVERIRIATDGKVGIGTASPQQRLHVEGTSNQAIFVNTSALGSISGSGQIGYAKALPTGSGNRLGYFLVGSRGGAENNFNTAGMAGYAAGAWTAGSSHPTYLTFETTPSGSTSRVERIRIESGGNVGIGTTNPNNKLHVVGRGRFTDGLSVDESGIYSVHTTGNALEGYGESSSYGSGVYGSGYYGVQGNGTTYGVFGSSSTYGTYGSGLYGAWGQANSTSGYGVVGIGGYTGTYGSGDSYGAYGYSSAGSGAYGGSYSGNGAQGSSSTGIGVNGSSYDSYGVQGVSTNSHGGNFASTNAYGIVATTTNGFYAGVFYGSVYTTGGYYPSDRNLKENIKSFSGAMDIINKLNPQQYDYKKDEKYAFLNLPKGNRYGIMAQDLEKVLPNLVSTTSHQAMKPVKEVQAVKLDAKGLPIATEKVAAAAAEKPEIISIKAVNYVELIPIMVKAMQEQQAQLEDQQKIISSLQEQVAALTKGKGTAAPLSNATLGQVSPNPVNGTARISYSVPESAGVAQLLVTDALGRTIKQMRLARSGVVDLNTSALSSGVYNYSLVVDNQTISTKKMTVIR